MHYGRGQVEWALWRSFTRAGLKGGDAPPVFLARIKRLLDIDRELDLSDVEVPPEADYAFVARPSSGSGEAEYTAADAFCLAIALDLLDAGFKQSEVVFLMRYLRPELERRFRTLLKRPSLIDRQHHRAEDYPGVPSYEERGRRYADGRVFVLVQKLELTEIRPGLAGKKHVGPIFSAPVYCEGVEALGRKLHDTMPLHRRTVTILELAATAQTVQMWLDKAPLIRRGRPKG